MNEHYARRAFERAVNSGVEGLWPATNTRWPLQIDSMGGYEDPHINAAWIGFKLGAVPASWLLLVESFMRSQEGEVSQGAAADMRRGIEQFAIWLTDPFGALHAVVTGKQQGYVDPRVDVPDSPPADALVISRALLERVLEQMKDAQREIDRDHYMGLDGVAAELEKTLSLDDPGARGY